MNWTRQFLDDPALRAGLIVGVAGLVVTFLFQQVIPGRPLNDPLPLPLAFQQILSGLLYFDWQSPVRHLLFALVLGGAAATVVCIMYVDDGSVSDAGRAGRLAAFINVGIIAALNVDAFIVLIFYAIGGIITMYVTARTAEWSYILLSR